MKYSALIVFVALAVSWSLAEARYNKYQNDLITAMNNWAIEEMRDVPEPHKTRITNKLNEAKNKEWDSVGLYFKNVQSIMLEALTDLLSDRSKRSIRYDFVRENVAETLQRISSAFSNLAD